VSYCQLQLTCSGKKEADLVANTLLVKHLVACVRKIPVSSAYRWQGKIEASNEVLLMMEAKLESFKEIEAEIAKLHSYKAFVLIAMPIDALNTRALKWLESELTKNE